VEGVKNALTSVNFWEDAVGNMAAIIATKTVSSRTAVSSTATTGERVFWSGGDVAKNAAMDYAKANGMKTLEMTTAGKVMNTLSPYLSRKVSAPIWDMLSSNFAKKATGSAHFFTSPSGPRPASIWLNTEKPILQQNGVQIINH